MLGCYETLISHTVKTTLLWFHIIKVHIFFGGVWQLSALFFLRGVEKEQIMIFHPWWWGCWGGRSSIELTVFGIGKLNLLMVQKYCYHQLRLGSWNPMIYKGSVKNLRCWWAGWTRIINSMKHIQFKHILMMDVQEFSHILSCVLCFFSN